MKRKLFEKNVHVFGKYANQIKMKKCDRLAMKLQVIEGKPKENTLLAPFLKSIEFYTTEAVDGFTQKAPSKFPNVFKYTSNQDDSKETLLAACNEWANMDLQDRWYLLKVISYFGTENEKLSMEKILKKSPPVSFDLLSGTVKAMIKKEESELGKKLNKWLEQAELEGF